MNFVCKEISIVDEGFGLTVTFSDRVEEYNFEKEQTIEEIMDSLGQYIMLQRTYGEDEFEEDYYYFETNDFDKSGNLKDFEISLTKNIFTLTFENEKYEIQIEPTEQEWNKLKEVLKRLTKDKGILNIN